MKPENKISNAADLLHQVCEANEDGGNLELLARGDIQDDHMEMCAGFVEENRQGVLAFELEDEKECLAAFEKLGVMERAMAVVAREMFVR